jgi:hypothetical protein
VRSAKFYIKSHRSKPEIVFNALLANLSRVSLSHTGCGFLHHQHTSCERASGSSEIDEKKLG